MIGTAVLLGTMPLAVGWLLNWYMNLPCGYVAETVL